MESSSLLAAVSDVFGLNYVLNILGLAEVIAKAGAPGEEVLPEKIEADVKVVKEEVQAAVVYVVKEVLPAKVEAAVEVVKEVIPEKVEAAVVEVVKEVVNKKVEAAVEVAEAVDHYVFGAGTVQKESKKGKKSYKN